RAGWGWARRLEWRAGLAGLILRADTLRCSTARSRRKAEGPLARSEFTAVSARDDASSVSLGSSILYPLIAPRSTRRGARLPLNTIVQGPRPGPIGGSGATCRLRGKKAVTLISS